MAKRIAVYLRLSLEDIDIKNNSVKDESNSITSQRNMIHQYLDGHPQMKALPRSEYCDDGFSGTNFERPSFQQMIEQAKNGRISCIVVKDLSRFGRDYLEVGDYLEHIFPFLGIRFISINDHYDSDNHTGQTIGMDITFRNLIYDYYSKDLSVKVKSAMRLRQNKGEYVNCVPYGYKRHETRKHLMVIDEPAAEIVRGIFAGILAGNTTSQVAAELNAKNIPTPTEYKGSKKRSDLTMQWTRQRIHSIIRNIKYTGTMTNHTRESRRIRDSAQARVPKSEWVIKEDAHEPIISKEDWERANTLVRKNDFTGRKSSDSRANVFYCSHCGRKLQKYSESDTLYCPSAYNLADSPCRNVRVSRGQLESVLISSLQAQISLFTETTVSHKNESRFDAVQIELKRIKKDLADIPDLKLSKYEAYRNGEVSRDAFLAFKNELAQREQTLTSKLEELEQQSKTYLEKEHRSDLQADQRVSALQIVSDVQSGMKHTLYQAIDRVDVADSETIAIKWKFADIFNPYR